MKDTSSCYHEGCGVIFRSLKLKLIHHKKVDSICHNETLWLVKLVKIAHKVLLSLRRQNYTKKCSILRQIQVLHEEIKLKFQERAKEEYLELMNIKLDYN